MDETRVALERQQAQIDALGLVIGRVLAMLAHGQPMQRRAFEAALERCARERPDAESREVFQAVRAIMVMRLRETEEGAAESAPPDRRRLPPTP
jgi:hypothetical protein